MKKYFFFPAILISVMMIFGVVAPVRAADDFDFLLVYGDVQAYSGSRDLRHGNNSDHVDKQQLPYGDVARNIVEGQVVYLAQNELEGFQVFYFEAEKPRSLRMEVSPFINGEGDILPATLYREEYFTPAGVTDLRFADALVPYRGETMTTTLMDNAMFYVELSAAKTQPAGNYEAKVSLYENDTLLAEKKITAMVWDFAVPESHYTTMVSGLYNSNSGYGDTRGFLMANGIRFDAVGEVLPDDVAKAEAILEGWQEFLLQHGISSYELPRWLITKDPKAAALTMADPRRKVFTVPLSAAAKNQLYAGNSTGPAFAEIEVYKELVNTDPLFKEKAFFYPLDEPAWRDDGDTAAFKTLMTSLETLWPGGHSVVPFNGSADFSTAIATLKAKTDILCMNHTMVAGNEDMRREYQSDAWRRAWLYYPGNLVYGGFDLHRWGKSTIGPFRRAVFWQQELLGGDGVLYWNCAYLPMVGGKPTDVWAEHKLTAGGAANVNGDGLLVYPGMPVGEDATTPIASLRLKQIAAGMDDQDYLRLASEFLPAATRDEAIKAVIPYYEEMRIFTTEAPDYNFRAWSTQPVNNARHLLGNALSSAATDHDYGSWRQVVAPDATHAGAALRRCNDCGAEESCALYAVTCEATNGVVSVVDDVAKAGDSVVFRVTAADGYEVAAVKAISANGEEIPVVKAENGSYRMTMVAANVRIQGMFRAKKYSVTVTDGTATPKEAAAGDTVTVTAANKPDHTFAGWRVTQGEVTLADTAAETTTFQMVAADVAIAATYAPIIKDDPIAAFHDVPEDCWYRDAVAFAVAKKLMVGMAPDRFDPHAVTTRAMIVVILHRLEGSPKVASASPFRDVPAGRWYSEAILWGDGQGVVNGYGDGTFGPNDPIKREQMAAILYRYATNKGFDVSKAGDLTVFKDRGAISAYAVPAMKWAVAEGLIRGLDNGTVAPSKGATRAEFATILQRFYEKFIEKS